jgi:hypothetical protein
MGTALHLAHIHQFAPAANDFGHRPILINQGMCGGCERCPDEEREVCARCHTVTREWGLVWQFDENDEPTSLVPGWNYEGHTTDWPCSTAVVLGLADMDGELLEGAR